MSSWAQTDDSAGEWGRAASNELIRSARQE